MGSLINIKSIKKMQDEDQGDHQCWLLQPSGLLFTPTLLSCDIMWEV